MKIILKNFEAKVNIVWYGIPDLGEFSLESTYNRIFEIASRNIISKKALTC